MSLNPILTAHKAGCDYARRIDASLKSAMVIACGLSTEDERFAFIAGYRCTLRRMVDAGRNVESAITANKINPAN